MSDVLLVIYGPTPPNDWAPQGCETGESYGDPNAFNAGNYGLLQINYASHHDKLHEVTGLREPSLLFNPATNIAVGYLVWEAAGRTWLPWSCRP